MAGSTARDRKFGSLRILSDGRVRFSAWTFAGLPQLDFTAVHGSDRNTGTYSIHAEWEGEAIFLIFMTRHRVGSTCFAYTLTPEGIRNAIDVLRAAGNGLERWIIPGLESCQRELARMKPKPNREALRAIIPELLESVRDLPVAPQWRRRLRALAAAERPLRRHQRH